MTKEEISSTIEQVKAQVKAKPEYKDKTDDEIDEAILDNFFKEYTDGKMSKEDLGAIADAMGYEFTEDFDKEEEVKDAPGVTTTEAEEVKAMKPGETKEEFKEKVEEAKAPENPAPSPESDDEDKEREEASKLWGIDLTKKKEEEK